MLDSLTPGELDEWIAYREIEPDPMERIVRLLAVGFAALCNVWGAKVKPVDFLPDTETEAEECTPSQASAAFRTQVASRGGTWQSGSPT